MITTNAEVVRAWQVMFAIELLESPKDDVSLACVADRHSALAKEQLVEINYRVLDDSEAVEPEGIYNVPADPISIIADGYQLGGNWVAPEDPMPVDSSAFEEDSSWSAPSDVLVVDDKEGVEPEGVWNRPDIWFS